MPIKTTNTAIVVKPLMAIILANITQIAKKQSRPGGFRVPRLAISKRFAHQQTQIVRTPATVAQ
jgi:hypothetical protein